MLPISVRAFDDQIIEVTRRFWIVQDTSAASSLVAGEADAQCASLVVQFEERDCRTQDVSGIDELYAPVGVIAEFEPGIVPAPRQVRQRIFRVLRGVKRLDRRLSLVRLFLIEILRVLLLDAGASAQH
jgi:hypothetical protein